MIVKPTMLRATIAFFGTLAFLVSAADAQEKTANVSLSSLKNAELMKCASDYKCGVSTATEISEEFARRKVAPYLIRSYRRADDGQKAVILEALYFGKASNQITEFMRKVAYSKPRNTPAEFPLWYALQYLARRCEPEALDRLLAPANYSGAYPIGCMYWQDSLRQFGKCGYRRAIPRLKKVAVGNYACLNINEAAQGSLAALGVQRPDKK